MISASISGLESTLSAPLQTKQMFFGKTWLWSGRFVKGWQPLWLGGTNDDHGQKRCCTVRSPASTCMRSRWQASSNSPFPKLKGKPPFSVCKSGIVVVLERSIGARLIKRHKQCWHFTARASEDHYVFSMSVSHYCVCDMHTLTGVKFILRTFRRGILLYVGTFTQHISCSLCASSLSNHTPDAYKCKHMLHPQRPDW